MAAQCFLSIAMMSIATLGWAQSKDSTPSTDKKVIMHATGDFTVKLEPQSGPNSDSKLGRMTIDKQFHGDLEGTSVGQMLSAQTDVKGSAGYVAIEKVTGKLSGRTGSFVLQHFATMDRGAPSLKIIVVPDSGSGELVGIAGTMNIIIANGQHSYVFDYTLP